MTLKYRAMKMKVAQSCPTLCDPMDYRAVVQKTILKSQSTKFGLRLSAPI